MHLLLSKFSNHCLNYLADYFVMWDEKIIHQLIHSKDKLTSQARKFLFHLKPTNRVQRSSNNEPTVPSVNNQWLSSAQDLML